MFYAHFVLAKKGPLARIWLAAHWDKKLTKAHVFETNIEKSVDGILQPKVKMALRTSGHLLLGVVRIYSRKAKYLLADCNEAFVKIKMAFRPGMVDLPEDIREAAVSAITFPEVFHDFDTPMPELNDVDIQAQFTLNQSRAEEITMREDYGNIIVTGDDGFGDMGFEEGPELMRGASSAIDASIVDQSNLIFSDSLADKDKDKAVAIEDGEEQNRGDRVSAATSAVSNPSGLDLEAPIRDDGFGGHLGQDLMNGGLFESGLFDDGPMDEAPAPLDPPAPSATAADPHADDGDLAGKAVIPPDDSDDDGGDLDRFGGPPSVGPPSLDGGSPCPSPPGLSDDKEKVSDDVASEAAAVDQTTLLHNDEESFALAPVDSSAVRAGWGAGRAKRKRKLIVDEVKNISGEEMKAQLSDTTDIVTPLDLAPPLKRLMHWKESGGVEKLFALPGRALPTPALAALYSRQLTSQLVADEEFGTAADAHIDVLRLDHVREEDLEAAPRPRGRPPKRKLPEAEAAEKAPPTSKSRDESFNELLSASAPLEEPPVEAVDEIENEMPPPDESLMSPDEQPPIDDAPLPPLPPLPPLSTTEPLPTPTATANDESFNALTEQNDSIVPEMPPNDVDFGGDAPCADDVMDDAAGEVESDEQADDETYEEFEERVVNKRAGILFHSIKKKLRGSDIDFASLSKGNDRKTVAQRFYSLLVLKKLQAVELAQTAPYAILTVSKGPLFDRPQI